ncbi:MAG: hypothetical protein K9N21_20050 [Deltaproteobacteria bacterium]|nr:hypothetical protein [Deltaproteobacteria bacterium]
MKRERGHYTAKLSGTEKIEFYLKNLASSSAFSFIATERKEKLYVEISGPKKISDNESLDDIEHQLSNRARELGIDAPKLVRDVGQDIFNAQKAEEIVLDGPMQLEATPNKEAEAIIVKLTLVLDGDPKVDECIDQYALLRVIWLANSLGMNFEEFEKKTVPLH